VTLAAPNRKEPVIAAPLITTTDGAIRGSGSGRTNRYLGVPFAAPPVGDPRGRPPQPARPWTGVREATHFAPCCPQTGSAGAEVSLRRLRGPW
jgi:para-nitrobenzyl esterase